MMSWVVAARPPRRSHEPGCCAGTGAERRGHTLPRMRGWPGALTRMHRWVPGGRQVRTSRVTKWAAEGLLCRLTLEGRAATVAQFRYRGQLSVGLGLSVLRAACQSWTGRGETRHRRGTSPARTPAAGPCMRSLAGPTGRGCSVPGAPTGGD